MIDYSKESPSGDRPVRSSRARSVYLYAIGILLFLAVVAGGLIWYTGNLDREMADISTRTPSVATTTALPAPKVTAKPTTAPAAAVPTTAPTTKPSSTATPSVARLKVGNTGGSGANLRKEANANSPVLAAWADGSIVESAGPDVKEGNVTWKQVKDSKGNVGYMAADFLAAAE